MGDEFYFLQKKSLKAVKEILVWAKNNSLKVNVDMLTSKSFSRVPADKSFEEVLSLLTSSALPYFVIILRKQMNLYGILYDDLHVDDILEIGIRDISVGQKEYFFIIYLDKKKLGELKKKYNLEMVQSR